MNEMRKLMEAFDRAMSGRRVAESEMQTYDVEYTVTVNVPVEAEDKEAAEEAFFGYLFENELQFDHNFGLDLGEVKITESGRRVAESQMKEYDVEYTVTVNVPVEAEDKEAAEEAFFGYLFENELQMDHNFGLDLGEVKITESGRRVAESQPGMTGEQEFTDWMRDAGMHAKIAVEPHGGMTEDGKHEVYVHIEHEGIMLTLDGVLELKWDAQAEADWLAGSQMDEQAGQGAQKGGITFEDLINGKVGRVRAEEPGDEEEDEEDVFVIDGHKYGIVKSVASDVVNFVNKHIDADQSNLILFKEHGYRGYFAYYGAIHVKGKWYGLDIMSEDDVFLLQKEPPGRTTPKYAMPF